MVRHSQRQKKSYSRRDFLSRTLAMPLLVDIHSSVFCESGAALSPNRWGNFDKSDGINVRSPNGNIQFEFSFHNPAQLRYQVSLKNKPVIENSLLGIIVDGVNLGDGVGIGKIESYRISERYPWRGVHSEAINQCNGAKINLTHAKSHTRYVVEVRASNDGIAFRFIVAGDARPRVPDETTGFMLPAGSTVWYHDFEGHYEGIHVRKEISEVEAGEWAAPPLTIKLPNNGGYAAITEAALLNYSGMGFEADGQRGFKARLGHALPVSYPFRLRYAGDVERLARPAAITGMITTPWRVVMIGADLNALVNCDIIHNVSLPPDKNLFPQGMNTAWLKPGRAVWKYLDGGENTLDEMKNFSRLAGQLGFEYNVVEGFWQKWSEDQMRELVDYSRQYKVGVWFWKHSRDLGTQEARQQFFTLLNRVGVVGAKIDFFDHEAKEIIDLYQTLLREAAQHHILVDFHGANKPAGESRTWPNEMTREGIRGLEYRKMETRAVHDTTLPFTRFLAGHADYTPMHFGERRRETSWAHQIASAAIFTSPVLIYGAHPKNILENPAVDLIKSIPSTWDETIALPPCEIGGLAAFVRRHGDRWFLTIMNGANARMVQIPLAFLGAGKYQAMLVRDQKEDAAAVTIENLVVSRSDSIKIELRAGGGFIGRFTERSSGQQ